MSLTTDFRSYADAAVAQGKNALTQAEGLLVTAGRRLATDAPKPAYAALGAADLIAATVTKRAEDFPVDAVNGVTKAQHTGEKLIARAQTETYARMAELRERLQQRIELASTLPATAKSTGESYVNAARDAGQGYLTLARSTYSSLTERGESKAARLQQDPRLAKLFSQVGAAGEQLVPAAKSAFDDVITPAEPKPARRASARKPATKASTRPATKKAPAKKAPAKKAASRQA